jgi:hypothetical protein
MNTKNLDSARSHLRKISTAQNKNPLHSAVEDLFRHQCEAAGIRTDYRTDAEIKAEKDSAERAAKKSAKAAEKTVVK